MLSRLTLKLKFRLSSCQTALTITLLDTCMNGSWRNLKTGILAYSGCTETADYREAKNQKGFLHVKVNEKGEINPESIELESHTQIRYFGAGFHRYGIRRKSPS